MGDDWHAKIKANESIKQHIFPWYFYIKLIVFSETWSTEEWNHEKIIFFTKEA